MDCPKCKETNLKSIELQDNLSAYQCSKCEGNWINGEGYKIWQSSQISQLNDNINKKNKDQDLQWIDQEIDNFTPSDFDTKAAFCPECSQYLSRGKVSINPPFYLERCPQCKGIWCDGNEWEALKQLNLHFQLDNIFSSEWQSLVRNLQSQQQEKQALIDKIGKKLATHIFALGDLLAKHPYGDFAVAYLMRKVGESKQNKK